MEKENKKLKITANKKIVVFSLIALALLIIGSTSYAYFTAVIEGNDSAKQTSVTTGKMSVKLINTEEINLNGMMPGDSKEVHFSVQNTGSATATYGVGLLISENNFGDKNDLVYTITSDNNGGSKAQSVLPSKSTTPSTLIPVVSIPTGKTQNYTMTITFKETNDNQNDNQGKTFTGKIQLVDANRNLLATKILLDNTLITQTPDFSVGEPPYDSSLTNTGSGLYKTVDDDGDTYYFRGNVENNYVKFGAYDTGVERYKFNGNSYDYYEMVKECPIILPDLSVEECLYQTKVIEDVGKELTWRIVRINGDGTIRLMLTEYADWVAYDNINYMQSTTRMAIDRWHNKYLKNYDDKIADGNFCIDTSIYKTEGGTNYYGSYGRLVENNSPSLKCPTPEDNFGGVYKMKVGLLTADEAALAGMVYEKGIDQNKNYLNYTHLMNPSSSQSYWVNDGGPEYYLTNQSITSNYCFGAVPVINLKADVTVVSGDGTADNPYTIE